MERLKQFILREALLNENTMRPKAIFLGGPAGSGKSTFVKQYLSNAKFKVINIDTEYERMLKQAQMSMRQTQYTADELSKAAKMQAAAKKVTDEKLQAHLNNLENIIIDGTAAAKNPILNRKKELEQLGYDTMMILIFVSPITSLQRNAQRGQSGGRELKPSIILTTWNGVAKNINEYQNEFAPDFILVDNNPEDAEKGFSEELIEPFVSAYISKGKEKTPEELEKRRKRQEKLYTDITTAVNKFPKADDQSQIKTKIQNFINRNAYK